MALDTARLRGRSDYPDYTADTSAGMRPDWERSQDAWAAKETCFCLDMLCSSAVEAREGCCPEPGRGNPGAAEGSRIAFAVAYDCKRNQAVARGASLAADVKGAWVACQSNGAVSEADRISDRMKTRQDCRIPSRTARSALT